MFCQQILTFYKKGVSYPSQISIFVEIHWYCLLIQFIESSHTDCFQTQLNHCLIEEFYFVSVDQLKKCAFKRNLLMKLSTFSIIDFRYCFLNGIGMFFNEYSKFLTCIIDKSVWMIISKYNTETCAQQNNLDNIVEQ